MNTNLTIGDKIRTFLLDHIVMLIFIVFVVFGFMVSETISPSGFANEVISRVIRNGVLVLSLIVPVMAGLGLNFGMTVGALAGMLAIIFVRYNYTIFPGIGGLILCFVVATPIAILFGYLTGKLYNKTKGQELIAGLMLNWFATGLYMVFVLFVIGGIIPVQWGHRMVNPVPEGELPLGLRHSFDMGMPIEEFTARTPEGTLPGMARALNNVWRMEFAYFLAAFAVAVLLIVIVRYVIRRKNPATAQPLWKFGVQVGLCAALTAFALISASQIYTWYQIHAEAQLADPRIRLDQLEGISPFVVEISRIDRIPVVTVLIILAVALFITYFTKTKLGQDCRAVGQSQAIANVSGIDVDKTRIIATIISTLLAAWGMIIFLQDVGTVNTYTHHTMIGMFSVAAILVGGATVARASVKNVAVGLVLFHGMAVLSPAVGRYFSESELVGEYTRSLMVYGVIGLSLGLYVWRANKAAAEKERLPRVLDTKLPPVQARAE